jgi:predicted nuclease with TOPRIM domain
MSNQLKEVSAKYSTLIKKIKDQEGEVEDLKKQRGELEQELMDLLVDSGLDQIRVTDAKMTLYRIISL